jgi:hypothetical protein
MSDINYVAHSATNCKLEEIAAPTPADPFDQASPRINSASVPNLGVLLVTVPVKSRIGRTASKSIRPKAFVVDKGASHE